VTAPSRLPLVADVRITRADAEHIAQGIEAWATLRVRGFRIDGVTVRRLRTGALAVVLPCRRDRSGRMHAYVSLLDDDLKCAVEAAVLDAYREAVEAQS
jgi:hypothetical protein